MKYYIAASAAAQQEMLGVRDVLTALGHTITSRWLDVDIIKASEVSGSDLAHSLMDIDDIRKSDTVLVFTKWPSTTGGMHVELGYALAIEKPVILVGPETNIFHKLATEQYRDWGHFLMSVTRENLMFQ